MGNCNYLPHHAVFKESATTPIRVVYDSSCRQSQEHPSLNESLLPGPPITKDLTAIFLRFRCRKYGFATDIGKAFLNISLDEQNRDASRFFWSRLTCVKAFVLRLVRNTRKQNQKKAALTTQELAHAQRFSIFST